jgi:chitin disaccharide deacetylase
MIAGRTAEIVCHADDAGISAAVTARIAEAWLCGRLDGFSALANGPALEAVARALASDPARPVRLGVHLNLTHGSPVAADAHLPALVRGGRFFDGFGGLLRRSLGVDRSARRALVREVETEWRAQIARVRNLCAPRAIRVLDGHVHVHMLPLLFPVAARLARELGIPEIRIAAEPLHISDERALSSIRPWALGAVKLVTLRGMALGARRIADREGLAYPDAFVGVLHSGRMTAGRALAGVAAAQRAGARRVEALFHLGPASREEVRGWTPDADIEFQTDPRRAREVDELARFREALHGRS